MNEKREERSLAYSCVRVCLARISFRAEKYMQASIGHGCISSSWWGSASREVGSRCGTSGSSRAVLASGSSFK